MVSRREILAGALGMTVPLQGAPRKENVLRFNTVKYDIVIAVDAYDRYSSQGFWFDERATQDHFCLSDGGDRNRDCLKGFVGSLAVVKYRFRSQTGDVRHTELREHVRTIDQDDTLPQRAPTDRAIELIRGLGSDIQALELRRSRLHRSHFQRMVVLGRSFARTFASTRARLRFSSFTGNTSWTPFGCWMPSRV